MFKTNISRRRFLRSSLALGALAAAGRGALAGEPLAATAQPFQRALPIPPLLQPTANGGIPRFSLQTGAGASELVAGLNTPTWGYNGSFLGPALRVPARQRVRMSLRNTLPESTTIHWHGAHVPGAVDGGPHELIAAGATMEEDVTFEQRGATLWYHPHPHGRTGAQVWAGLAGLLLLDDGSDERLALPRTWGVDDIPLILQDRRIAADGKLLYMPDMMDVMGMMGDRFLVNGCEQPYVQAPAQWVRLRILNGSNARLYNLAFRDKRSFYMIASDGGLLGIPVKLDHIRLSPAERAEILVDLRSEEGKTLILGSYDAPKGETGIWRGPTTAETDLLQLRVGPKADHARGQLSEVLSILPRLPQSPEVTHDFELGMMGSNMMMSGFGILGGLLQSDRGAGVGPGGMNMGGAPRKLFSINRQYMDMQRINLSVPQHALQVWRVRNVMQMNHSFHVHGTSFRILERDGAQPPEEERGWKDTVALPPHTSAVLAMQFDQTADAEHPYMYHCHVLEHEDNGMMGQFTVS